MQPELSVEPSRAVLLLKGTKNECLIYKLLVRNWPIVSLNSCLIAVLRVL